MKTSLKPKKDQVKPNQSTTVKTVKPQQSMLKTTRPTFKNKKPLLHTSSVASCIFVYL